MTLVLPILVCYNRYVAFSESKYRVGDPVFWGESFIEGQLGCPNPSANLIGVQPSV